MSDSLAYFPFDYDRLDAETALFVQQQTSEIKGLFKQTIENIIAIGQRLNQVKECLPHGQWLDWLAGEFSWTDRTARNYMQVAEGFKSENFADLNIAASALYLLAAPSTAEEAREEAISRAQAGERITVNAARNLRDKYTLAQAKPELQPQDLQPGSEAQEEQPQSQIQLSNQPEIQYHPDVEPTPKTLTPVKRKRARKEKPVIVAPKQTSPGTWWSLGKTQFLYCGKSSLAQFQKRLPPKVALTLLFASRMSDRTELPTETTSALCYGSPYGDGRDFQVLRELIQNVLELETEGGDSVVMLSLPDPAIFLLMQQMDVRCYCAELDPKRCDAAISAWTVTGQKAEKI